MATCLAALMHHERTIQAGLTEALRTRSTGQFVLGHNAALHRTPTATPKPSIGLTQFTALKFGG